MSLPPEIIAPREAVAPSSATSSGAWDRTTMASWSPPCTQCGVCWNSVGADFHAWAEHTEKPNGSGLNEAEAKKIFDAGYAMGVQDAENKQHGANDFRTTDGKPEWNDVALFLQRNKAPARCEAPRVRR